MIYLGVVFLILGVIGWAVHAAAPRSRPLSTIAMYIGLGIGAILVVVGLLVYATHGGAIEVDSSGQVHVQ